jgi:hypothetical protein
MGSDGYGLAGHTFDKVRHGVTLENQLGPDDTHFVLAQGAIVRTAYLHLPACRCDQRTVELKPSVARFALAA